MDEVVIKKKDVDRLAKELLKEVFDFFQDEYITEKFLEMKVQKSKFLNRLVFNHILYLNKKDEKENVIHKQFLEYFLIYNIYLKKNLNTFQNLWMKQ